MGVVSIFSMRFSHKSKFAVPTTSQVASASGIFSMSIFGLGGYDLKKKILLSF